MEHSEMEYVGFWSRVGASLIDSFLIAIVVIPILLFIYGPTYFTNDEMIMGSADFFLNKVAPAIFCIWFWNTYGQTPGKMVVGAQIVDAKTGGPITLLQCAIRYFGYIIGAIPLLLGYFWVALSPRKQGWHDLMAGTVVIRKKKSAPVTFDKN